MPLTFADASPRIASLAKPRLLRSLGEELSEGSGELKMSPPQPLYSATTEDILRHTLVDAKVPDSWQLLVARGGEPFATVEMRVERHHDGTEEYVYAGVFTGGHAISIYEGLSVAESVCSHSLYSYELRVIRAPTVYLYAVWLHARDNDVIIPCAPAPAPLGANQPMEPDSVCTALRELAEQQASGGPHRRERMS